MKKGKEEKKKLTGMENKRAVHLTKETHALLVRESEKTGVKIYRVAENIIKAALA